jgi:hypothetical protein
LASEKDPALRERFLIGVDSPDARALSQVVVLEVPIIGTKGICRYAHSMIALPRWSVP